MRKAVYNGEPVISKIFIASLLSFLAGGCTPTAAPQSLLAPADSSFGIKPLRPESVMAGLADMRPVAPKDWRNLNRAVTPPPEKGSMENMPGMPHGQDKRGGE